MGSSDIILNNIKKLKRYHNINFVFKYNFIKKQIKRGNKLYALKIFNKLKYYIKNKFKKDSNLIFFLVFYNSLIKFHFIKKRFGGSKKDIPIYLNKDRQIKFVIKKIFNYSKSVDKRKSLDLEKLVNLFLYTIKKKGPLIIDKKKAFIKAKENRILIKSLKK
jgi:ribosomal protein S7